MRKLLFLAFAALLMSAMTIACGDNGGSSSTTGSSSSPQDEANEQRDSNPTAVADSLIANAAPDSISLPELAEIDRPDFMKSKKKALLIGVSAYKDKAWGKINSHNDIELLRNTLQNELGFVVEALTESNATHDGIVKALNDLVANCNDNDTIVIHFSGHGQQMVDIEGDEEDLYTECFIPFDAAKVCSNNANGYRGQCHFTDDEINKYITKLRKKIGKNGYLIVSIDACHSGSGTRDASDGRVMRGTNDIFGYGILEPAKRKGRTVAGTLNNATYVAISACQPGERNYEVVRNGKNYGALSFMLNEKLLEVKNGKLTLNKLATAIKNAPNYWKGQTPYIDNNGEYVQ